MKTSKKFLSLVLSIIMIACTVPMAYAEEVAYKTGDIIQFGSYPQSEVTDEVLLAELNVLAPEWDDWTSYGYYSGTGDYGTMVQGDWMRYTDITYNGSKYRGVKFVQYRPYITHHDSESIFNLQADSGYFTDIVYWFVFESIDWRILDLDTGLIMCETVIDAQPYSNNIYYDSDVEDRKVAYFNDSLCSKYANDYETSSIREWLNEDFYNTAFSNSDKTKISVATLDNKGYYTSKGTSGYDYFDSNETKDKIFLLSYNEIKTKKYGFDSNPTNYDEKRAVKNSDYAKCQGTGPDDSYSYWFLRSPGSCSDYSCFVSMNGLAYHNVNVNRTDGIRPGLKLNLEHQHTYSSSITMNPTHLKEGLKTYTCECGDSYTETLEKLEEHNYAESITKQPTHTENGVKTFECGCGDSYTKVIDKTKEHTYSKVVTAPTCSAQGFTTYICECNDSYVADYVDMLEHKDANGDYECDYGCGYEFEKNVASDSYGPEEPKEPDTPDEPSTSDEPKEEKTLNLLQKIIEWFKNFFSSIFSWFKR